MAAIWEAKQASGKTGDESARADLAATALNQYAAEMDEELLETEVMEYGAHLVEIAKEYEINKKRAAALQPQPGGASSSCDGPAPRVPAKNVATFYLHRGLTQAEAKRYLPPNTNISKDTSLHFRWQCRGSWMPVTVSKSFAASAEGNDTSALKHARTWQLHHECTGQPCPWEFGSELFDDAAR